MTDASRIVETADGYALIEPVLRLKAGEDHHIFIDGRPQFAKLQGRALITSDGEVIEHVEVMNRVSFFIR